MLKSVTHITLQVTTDLQNHRHAPHTLDGVHWLNNGDLAEVLNKHRLGYAPTKDGNGKWCDTSDIPETCTSCKSYRFTLTSERLGNTYEEVKAEYFRRTHSVNWDYIIIDGNTLIVYTMNRNEFAEYLDNFHLFENGIVRGVRSKKDINKMIEWLEARA